MFTSKGPQYSEIRYVNVTFSGTPNPVRSPNDYNVITTAVQGLWWERQKETKYNTEVVDYENKTAWPK